VQQWGGGGGGGGVLTGEWDQSSAWSVTAPGEQRKNFTYWTCHALSKVCQPDDADLMYFPSKLLPLNLFLYTSNLLGRIRGDGSFRSVSRSTYWFRLPSE
jgi:hypothetical protein